MPDQASPKIKRRFVKDEVYVRLRDRIVDGTLKPGAVLRDLDLAKQLGVSRTPIREALLKLEDEGFVITRPNRSTKVADVRPEDAYWLYSIVWTLEKLALEQGMKTINKPQIEAMSTYNSKLGQAIAGNRAADANRFDSAFHRVIIHSSGNAPLIGILAQLKQKLKRIELFYFTELDHLTVSCEEHERIIAAIKQANLTQACAAIEANWRNGWHHIETYKKRRSSGDD
ncbi:MAG: GntR family transcriptional regulator [Sporolactobacillus sp.]|jgi:DNA-binding GntR family transcriptional regulator|nr:GntR family transcriptional regulator [Sporolactobacillus sp.]